MEKYIKKLFKIIGMIIFIVIVVIIVVSVINLTFGLILPIIEVPMYVGTNVDWLNFIGLFLGSGVTLFGVWWQFKKNKEENYNRLISNTTAVYGMLKTEIKKINKHLNDTKETFEVIKASTSSNNFEDMSKNSGTQNEMNQYYKLVLPPFPKETIFNFINNSLPKQKIILIELTNDFYSVIEGIQKTDCRNILNERCLACEEHLQNIKGLMEKFEREKLNFEKLK